MYDLIVIGSGPAGYNAALIAAREKLKVVIFEENLNNLGGVCLNEGCIPLKGFLYYSKYEKNCKKIKQNVLNKIKILREGLKSRILNSGIEIINASAKIKSKNEISAGDKIYKTKNIIIAVGSVAIKFFNYENILTSEKISNIDNDFKKILIIGAGPTGLEYASFFNNLGKDVTIVEIFPFILPWIDKETINYYIRELNKKRIKLFLETRIEEITTGNEVSIIKSNEKIKEKFDIIIETTGRKPATSKIGLENSGVKIDEKGFIKVNENFQTNIENIFAIGDCINTPMLAYTASKEAEIVMQYILTGKTGTLDYNKIPYIVFSTPQIGKTGDINIDVDIKILKYFFKANGKAFIEGKETGFIKLFIDEKNNVINGGLIIGDEIAELLNELTIIIDNKIPIGKIKESVFLHPSYSEIILDALNYGI